MPGWQQSPPLKYPLRPRSAPALPFSRMETFEKQDVARYMLEEWIHMDIRKDKTEHQYDGRIEFEIPPQNIVCVHEVEDGFPEMDKWLFE